MLELSRGYVAYLLAGFGEPEVSASILKSSDEDFRRIQEPANQGALAGEEWLKVACSAAVELVEGTARDLRRRQLDHSAMRQELLAADNKSEPGACAVLSALPRREYFHRCSRCCELSATADWRRRLETRLY